MWSRSAVAVTVDRLAEKCELYHQGGSLTEIHGRGTRAALGVVLHATQPPQYARKLSYIRYQIKRCSTP